MKDRVVAKKKSDPAGDALRELEQTGDRVADWASQNAALILGVIAAILVIAAGAGLYVRSLSRRANTGWRWVRIRTEDPSSSLRTRSWRCALE